MFGSGFGSDSGFGESGQDDDNSEGGFAFNFGGDQEQESNDCNALFG